MGHLEEAAADEPYHAVKAYPHHIATGDRRRSWCSALLENEGWFTLVFTFVMMTVALLLVFAATAIFALTYHAPRFSVHLRSYDGIDPGHAARLVSPTFNITLRMNNTCVDRADVAVMYSGVALGWARAEPRDCAEGRWEKDVEIVAWGRGVGLSPRLRGRMASDWQDLGALELDVKVKKYYEGDDGNIPHVILKKVKIMDGKLPFIGYT